MAAKCVLFIGVSTCHFQGVLNKWVPLYILHVWLIGGAVVSTVGDVCQAVSECRGRMDGERCPTGQAPRALHCQVRMLVSYRTVIAIQDNRTTYYC